uniref:Uncharacterized protein n=1 Tax=Mycena chlorophos TaxID=658473 RepID=A0ABQ0MC83_MYCCL|nr:predicted protein [Mycena chlorophos]
MNARSEQSQTTSKSLSRMMPLTRPRVFSLPPAQTLLAQRNVARPNKRKADTQLSKQDCVEEPDTPSPFHYSTAPRKRVFYPPPRTPSSSDEDDEPYRLIPSLYERFPRLRYGDWYDGLGGGNLNATDDSDEDDVFQ